MTFALDPRLASDTLPVGDLALCRVLLMNDARYPWLILVPRRADLSEIVDLPRAEQMTLMDEIARVSEILRAEPGVEKINVGALGNIVRQLHVHVLGRRVGDHRPFPPRRAGPDGPASEWGRRQRSRRCLELERRASNRRGR